MIYIPTEMSLDAACLNQGEEIEREHEGHVWMISHPQLPAATSGSQQSPNILEEQKKKKNKCLYITDGLYKPKMPQ